MGVESNEPQDPSAAVVVCHLEVPQHVYVQWQAQDDARDASSQERYLMVAQDVPHGVLTF